MDNHHSADFGNLPNPSETFGTIPKGSELFRTVRNTSEKTENHTVTVREVARLFEQSGVPRTERSIINWCRLNRQGVARLSAFFGGNGGRYCITQQSVTRSIEEERAKQTSAGAAPVAPVSVSQSCRNPARRSSSPCFRCPSHPPSSVAGALPHALGISCYVHVCAMETIQAWECFDADSGKDLATELREYFIPDFSD